MMTYLDENVAHVIANAMLEVLDVLLIVDDLEDFEEELCNAIEPHIVAFWEDVFVEGEKSAWAES